MSVVSRETRSRRRWLRFSLRTLLIVLTAAALLLGWQTYRARQQEAVVARVNELGGSVVYDYQFENYDLNPKKASPPGPAWLRSLIGDDYFVDVVMVSLRKTAASDDDFGSRSIPISHRSRSSKFKAGP